MLNRKPENITILEIYESIEGKIDVPECPLDRQICPFDKCLMNNLVNDVTMQFKNYFEGQTLQDFVTRS